MSYLTKYKTLNYTLSITIITKKKAQKNHSLYIYKDRQLVNNSIFLFYIDKITSTLLRNSAACNLPDSYQISRE